MIKLIGFFARIKDCINERCRSIAVTNKNISYQTHVISNKLNTHTKKKNCGNI